MLLSEGRCMMSGAKRGIIILGTSAMLGFSCRLVGHACLAHCNPAEVVADLISSVYNYNKHCCCCCCCYAAAAAALLSFVSAVQLGHACPAHYNPAEFVADLISIDYSSPEVEQESKARVQVGGV
jgi:hypothetical protein